MKKLILKLALALLFGLGLTLSLLGLMTYLHPKTVHAAGPHHVAPSCAGVPAPCYTTIQAAVDAAAPGDVIMVAAGTYAGVTSRAGVTQTVYISKSVTIRGGYTTAFTEPPDPQANPTTLDAQGQGRVIYIIGNITPTIEGLRITGGNGNGLGGGPFNDDGGGGVLIDTATVSFKNNEVIGNTDFDGGGLFLWQGNAEISNNFFAGNTAGALGGGVVLYSSSAKLRGNTILANAARGNGGLAVFDCRDVTLINNVIVDNLASYNGLGYSSGILISDSSVRLSHNTIAQNTGGYGSAIYVTRSSVALTNTILASHTLGITVTADSTVTLANTLWYGNIINLGGAGVITSTNNYTDNPVFIDPANYLNPDFHINSTSAAIDKGINAGVATDIDGQPRPQGAGFDLGADEYLAPLVPLTGVTINGPLTGALNESYPFSATISPTTATPPITYTWSPAPESGQGTASVTYTWPVTGAKTITVTAAHAGGVVTDTHLTLINAPSLNLRKSGPTTAAPGDLITYTLTVTNSGSLTATNLIITDTVPANATYISGGTKVGTVVSWTVPSLPASGGITETTFVVTATQTITNSDYGVRADGGYTAQGSVAVVTTINAQAPESKVFVPVILKQ